MALSVYVIIVIICLAIYLIMFYCDFYFLSSCYLRLFAEISTPIECLVFEETINHTNGKSPYVIYELTQLLFKSKEAFLDLSVIQALMHHLELLLEKVFATQSYCRIYNGV